MGKITREDRLLLRRYGWLPNNPDLNPVDYGIWGALQERVYHGRKFEKQAIVLEWRALSQRFIDGSINQWRRRLQGVVQENGGHIRSSTGCRHLYSSIVVCCRRYKR